MPRRRTKGTGSITLRGRIYHIEYQHEGRRLLRESANTSDPDEAMAYLKRRIGEVTAGDIAPSKATIGDLCQLVFRDYEARGLRNLKGVRWVYDANIKPVLGSLLASRFGAGQIRAYIAARREGSASNATINREFSIVRRGFVLGTQEEPPLVKRVPYIPELEESEPRQGFIEKPQYELLLALMPAHLKCALVIGYHYGIRLGELRKLKWSQVDYEAQEIRLQSVQTKSKARRVLPIYGDVQEWLERQRERCTGERMFCWRPGSKSTKEQGLSAHLRGWGRACEAAGLPDLHFHDLRRSAVRNMERAGIPRAVSMRITGHKTESVYRRYDIVSESDFDEARIKMEEFNKQGKVNLRRVK